MSEFNPYAPPETNPIPAAQPGQNQTLASPWIRLGAAIIDGLIVMFVCIPVMWVFHHIGVGGDSFTTTSDSFSFRVEGVFGQVVWFAVWVAVNWSSLQSGQTIEKRLLGLRVVRKDGSPIPAQRIVTHRQLPLEIAAMVSSVPIIRKLASLAILIDALLIFRSGHNTWHDDIADTKVVRL